MTNLSNPTDDDSDQTKVFVNNTAEFETNVPQVQATPHDEFATLEQSGSGHAPPASSSLPRSIKYFGDYEILGEIARGGMGVVYKARQSKLNRIVAIKMMLSGEHASEEAISRFFTEAQAAATLDHPGIVPVYEIGRHEGKHYFAMGFIAGKSLAEKVALGPLPPKEAAEITQKIAEAIAYAHGKGVIHRDLKPANVLLDANGEPKVSDFGLARKIEQDSGITRTGAVMGTPSYMPPEQAAGETNQVGPLSDVYSLGAILYCLLTGKPPFQGSSPIETIRQVIEREPIAPGVLVPSIPKDLETICLKCLRKPLEDRYGSATELAQDLGRFLVGESILARPSTFAEKTWRWAKRRPLIVSVCVLTILLCGLTVFSWNALTDAIQSRRIVITKQKIDDFLSTASLDDIGSPTLAKHLAGISQWSPEQSKSMTAPIIKHFESLIREELNAVRMTDSQIVSIEQKIDALEAISDHSLDEIRSRLEEIRTNWVDALDVRSPFENLSSLFAADEVVVDQTVIRKKGEPKLLESSWTSQDAIRIEASFKIGSTMREAFGIAITQTGQEGYSFMAVPVQGNGDLDDSQSRDLAKDRKTAPIQEIQVGDDEAWELQLRRAGTVLRSTVISGSEIKGETVRLVAFQDGEKLRIECNAMPPMEFEDLFPLPLQANRRVSFYLPARGGLEAVRIRTRRLAARPNPLVEANQSYFAGDFSHALELYSDLLGSNQTEGDLEAEIRYKIGLCRCETKEIDKAKEVLLSVAVNPESKWFIPATIQLWLISLRERKSSEAYDYYLQLASNAQWKDVASVVPSQLREEILKAYEVRDFGSLETLGAIFKDSNRLERMRQLLAISDLMDNDDQRSWYRRFYFVRQFLILNDRQGALDLIAKMKANPLYYQSTYSLTWEVLATNARLDPNNALERIDDFLRVAKMDIEQSAEVILLRIEAMHALGNFAEVKRLLRLLQEKQQGLPSEWDPIFWAGDLSNSMCLRKFKLLQGLVAEEEGKPQEALACWKEAIAIEMDPKLASGIFAHTGDMTALYAFSGRFGREQATQQARRLLGGATSFAKTISASETEDALVDTIIAMWTSEIGREVLKDLSWERIPLGEKGFKTLEVFLIQFGLERLCWNDAAPAYLKDLQRFVRYALGWFSKEEEMSSSKIVQIGLCWKGNSGLLGWQSLAPQLKPESRGMLAYILAKRSIVLGKIEDAKKYYETAVRDLPRESGIQEYANAELKLLEENLATLWVVNRCSQPIELELVAGSRLLPVTVPADGSYLRVEIPVEEMTTRIKMPNDGNYRLSKERLMPHLAGTVTLSITPKQLGE